MTESAPAPAAAPESAPHPLRAVVLAGGLTRPQAFGARGPPGIRTRRVAGPSKVRP